LLLDALIQALYTINVVYSSLFYPKYLVASKKF